MTRWRDIRVEDLETLRRTGRVEVEPELLAIWLPRRLDSPNRLLHAHWKQRHDDKQAWLGLLVATIQQTVGWSRLKTLGLVNVRTPRRLSIERRVPSVRNFIRDRENLLYSGKHLVDRIRDLGLIRDDSMQWIDLDITQAVSDDGLDWTVIRITPRAEPS